MEQVRVSEARLVFGTNQPPDGSRLVTHHSGLALGSLTFIEALVLYLHCDPLKQRGASSCNLTLLGVVAHDFQAQLAPAARGALSFEQGGGGGKSQGLWQSSEYILEAKRKELGKAA
jgi:hypothetical protein